MLAAGSSSGNSDNNLKEQTQRMLSGKKVLRPLPVMFLPVCGSALRLQGLHPCHQPPEELQDLQPAVDAALRAIKVCRMLLCGAGATGGAMRHGASSQPARAQGVGDLCLRCEDGR